MDHSIVLNELKKLGSAPMRVAWFGDINYSGLSGGSSPHVAVVLNPLIASPQGTRLLNPFAVQLPVAFLRLLRIGDIWQKGRHIGPCTGSTRLSLPNLLIDDATTDARPAGLPVEAEDGDSHYLLPFSEFDAHRNHTGAFCISVKVDDATVLVIPCLELIRFYFGESGALLNRLFSGALVLGSLYESAWRSERTGIAHVKLAPGIPRTAATTVARIAFSHRAERAASWIVKSGIAAAANREPYYPKTSFPFEGRTNLIVDGRWIDTEGHEVFLVERLVQCSHPFPFQKLFVKTSMSVSYEKNATTRSKRQSADSFLSLSEPNRTALAEGYVASGLVPIAIDAEVEDMNPFPDLANKRIHQLHDARSGHASSGDHSDTLVSGASSSSSGLRGAEVHAYQQDVGTGNEPGAVRVFQKAFQQLLDSYETAASLVPPFPNCNAKGKSCFLRCDWLVSATEERLQRIWCATALFPDQSKKPITILIQAPCPAGSLDRLVLISASKPPTGEDALISFCNTAFEAHEFPDHQNQIIGFLEGEATTDFDSVLGLIRELLRS